MLRPSGVINRFSQRGSRGGVSSPVAVGAPSANGPLERGRWLPRRTNRTQMTLRTARHAVAYFVASAAVAVAGLMADTATAGATTAPNTDVKVASFNLSSLAFDAQASGEHRTWRVRRPVIVSQVLRNRPDALGVQEANQSSSYTTSVNYGPNQYLDLKGALAAKGGHYALTNANAYNCVNP